MDDVCAGQLGDPIRCSLSLFSVRSRVCSQSVKVDTRYKKKHSEFSPLIFCHCCASFDQRKSDNRLFDRSWIMTG